jgi:LacI family transcriptional regulator
MEIARELGLRVPEDISVIGFDNVPESALTDPPLTTVAQPIHEMGAEALGMVIDLINGVSREPHVRLPTRLVARASCRPL